MLFPSYVFQRKGWGLTTSAHVIQATPDVDAHYDVTQRPRHVDDVTWTGRDANDSSWIYSVTAINDQKLKLNKTVHIKDTGV